jgi:hypothetical protein
MVCVASVLIAAGTLHSDGAPAAATLRAKADIYVAQSSTGSGGGSSCMNAKPASFFNTASNWGSGRPIAPGKIVGLCGTITSTLTPQASGKSGRPITIQFQAGARISQPVCAPCLNVNGRSYIVVDGGSNGIIESNANGTNLANHSNSTGITAQPCDNCEIKNLTIRNIYVIGSGDSWIRASGGTADNAGARCISFSGANWRIHHNVMHDASWCLVENGNGTDANNRIYNNNIYNFDHGWAVSGGGPYGKLYFYGNHVHDMGVWDNCNGCHHDGIHCFFGGDGTHFAGSYLYNNTFNGTVGSAATAWIYLEANSGSACADSTSHWYFFNNLLSSSDQVPTNGYIGSAGALPVVTHIFNNTFSGPGAGRYGVNRAGCVFAAREFVNNAVGGCARLIDPAGAPTDFNAYANAGGTNCFPTGGCNFRTWQRTGKDAHSVFNSRATVGSNARGIGTNLTSLCTGDLAPLCFDIDGGLRPLRMKPDAGAYQQETAAIAPRAIGRAGIGALQASIERFYGRRRLVRFKRPLFGAFDIHDALTATYRLHRGLFAVSYAHGKTVAVSTTSRYYTTIGGFGVGAPASKRELVRHGWRSCGPNLVRRRDGLVTAIRIARGHIGAVTLSRPEALRCP